MAACEACWVEASRLVRMLGGSTPDRYKQVLAEHGCDRDTTPPVDVEAWWSATAKVTQERDEALAECERLRAVVALLEATCERPHSFPTTAELARRSNVAQTCGLDCHDADARTAVHHGGACAAVTMRIAENARPHVCGEPYCSDPSHLVALEDFITNQRNHRLGINTDGEQS